MVLFLFDTKLGPNVVNNPYQRSKKSFTACNKVTELLAEHIATFDDCCNKNSKYYYGDGIYVPQWYNKGLPLIFTCSKSAIETIEKSMKYVQS